eukprot:14354711-Alexandrium_andersonii.AAC.1
MNGNSGLNDKRGPSMVPRALHSPLRLLSLLSSHANLATTACESVTTRRLAGTNTAAANARASALVDEAAGPANCNTCTPPPRTSRGR